MIRVLSMDSVQSSLQSSLISIFVNYFNTTAQGVLDSHRAYIEDVLSVSNIAIKSFKSFTLNALFSSLYVLNGFVKRSV